jgi:hypothetical protein
MLKRFLLCFVALLATPAYAEEDPLVVYVALSEVSMSTGKGTSEQLNHLIHHYGSSTGALEHSLASRSSYGFRKEIHVYNKDNIRFLHEDCNYIEDALGCGVKNGHWTLRTSVHVGDKYSTIIVKLYDEKKACGQVTFIN